MALASEKEGSREEKQKGENFGDFWDLEAWKRKRRKLHIGLVLIVTSLEVITIPINPSFCFHGHYGICLKELHAS